MSFVTIRPQMLTTAAGDLASIGSEWSAQNAAMAAPTTALMPAAADEVSALTAAQFSIHAHWYQAVSAQAEAIHDQFVAVLASSANSYAAAETVANAMTAS
jgi:hypothetical protein